MEDLSTPRMRYKVIGPGKPKRVSKGPWESRIGKGLRKPKEAHKVGPEEANGLEWTWKERRSKPMGSM